VISKISSYLIQIIDEFITFYSIKGSCEHSPDLVMQLWNDWTRKIWSNKQRDNTEFTFGNNDNLTDLIVGKSSTTDVIEKEASMVGNQREISAEETEASNKKEDLKNDEITIPENLFKKDPDTPVESDLEDDVISVKSESSICSCEWILNSILEENVAEASASHYSNAPEVYSYAQTPIVKTYSSAVSHRSGILCYIIALYKIF